MLNRIIGNGSELEQLVNERLRIISQLKDEIENTLQTLPEGRLHVSKRGNYKVFYNRKVSQDKTGIYIPHNNIQEAIDLANKEYYTKLLEELERQLYHLKALQSTSSINSIPSTIADSKHDLITPIFTSTEDYIEAWLSVKYETKSFEGVKTEHYTDNNERVRSKSEIHIANTLKKHGIPYRYEYPHKIRGLDNYHPDFTCLNVRRRKEIIWEHFGKMSDTDYSENVNNKIDKLTMSGLTLGDDFIFTMESSNSPLSTLVVEKTIANYLL